MEKTTIFIIGFLSILSCCARSPHRPFDQSLPSITAYWHDQKEKTFSLRESHLQQSMFVHFDKEHCYKNLLPTGPISYRYNPTQHVLGSLLSDQIENLLQEIKSLPRKSRPKQFQHFTILKMRDIDPLHHTGLYVLKFNNYPFVLKLFIENPESFVQPTEKGFEPMCFHYLAGVGRHITGLTRIKNLEQVKKITAQDPYWSNKLAFPRKWFWLPSKPSWMTIDGHNIGPDKKVTMTIPAVYGIVCDEIIWKKPFSLKNNDDKKIALDLSNFLQQRIDLHINNFGIEQGSNKLTIIDYEHFPTVVGLEADQTTYHGYLTWYSRLSCMMLKRMLFRNKEERRLAQYRSYKPLAVN